MTDKISALMTELIYEEAKAEREYKEAQENGNEHALCYSFGKKYAFMHAISLVKKITNPEKHVHLYTTSLNCNLCKMPMSKLVDVA